MTQALNLAQTANLVGTDGRLNASTGITGTLALGNGGTGLNTTTLVAGRYLGTAGSTSALSFVQLQSADLRSILTPYATPTNVTAGLFLSADGSGGISWATPAVTGTGNTGYRAVFALPKTAGTQTGAFTQLDYTDLANTPSQSFFVGTTSISLGRVSATQTLTGVSIDGNANTATSATSAGSASTAAALSGADANNRVPYNTAAGATSFVTAPSTDGTYFLQQVRSTTPGAPSWVSTIPTGSVATTLLGKTLGDGTLANRTVLTASTSFRGTEPASIIGTAPGTTVTYDLSTNQIFYYTANSSTGSDLAITVRGNSTTTLSSILNTGDVITFNVKLQNAGTAQRPAAAITVDSTSVTIKWAGGSRPSANTNSNDVYEFKVIKTGASSFDVLGSQTKYSL